MLRARAASSSHRDAFTRYCQRRKAMPAAIAANSRIDAPTDFSRVDATLHPTMPFSSQGMYPGQIIDGRCPPGPKTSTSVADSVATRQRISAHTHDQLFRVPAFEKRRSFPEESLIEE